LRAHEAAHRDKKVAKILCQQFDKKILEENKKKISRREKREAQRKVSKLPQEEEIDENCPISSNPPFQSSLALTALIGALSQGVFCYLSGLRCFDFNLIPLMENSLEGNYFHHRFHEYSQLQPPIDFKYYSNFIQNRKHLTSAELFDEARSWFKEAKSLHGILTVKMAELNESPWNSLLSVSEIRSAEEKNFPYQIPDCSRFAALNIDFSLLRRLLKVCVSNSINLMGIEKKLMDGKKYKTKISFEESNLIPIIKIEKEEI